LIPPEEICFLLEAENDSLDEDEKLEKFEQLIIYSWIIKA
jgi:hypothetical protein